MSSTAANQVGQQEPDSAARPTRSRELSEARWRRLERPRYHQVRGDPARAMHVLKSAFRKLGIDRDIDKYRFVLYWQQIVGPEIAKRARIEYLRGTTLMVRVASASWAQELTLLKGQILERLNQYTQGSVAVTDIRFEVGT